MATEANYHAFAPLLRVIGVWPNVAHLYTSSTTLQLLTASGVRFLRFVRFLTRRAEL